MPQGWQCPTAESRGTFLTMSPDRAIRPLSILGSTVNMVDIPFIVDWLCERIEQRAREGRCHQMLVTGFHGLNQAYRDPHFRRIGEECDLWVPDSIAPVLIARWRGMRGVVRTPGAEIMAAFFERADRRGYRSFFYGDTDQTLQALHRQMEQRYPGHQVVGTLSPPFRRLSEPEEQAHIDLINQARPDVVWVGLGLPKQDEWVYRCKDRLHAPLAIGVGAAFGFLAGTVPRAPAWACHLGLEWAYMLLRKPKRTGKRLLGDGTHFVLRVLQEEAARVWGRKDKSR